MPLKLKNKKVIILKIYFCIQSLNKLNQNFQPTDGFFTRFTQSVPIYSDDNSFENTLTASKYHSMTENFLLAGKLF